MTAGELLDLVGNTPVVEPPPIQIAKTDYYLIGLGCQMCKRSSSGECSACARLGPMVKWECNTCHRVVCSRLHGKQYRKHICARCGY